MEFKGILRGVAAGVTITLTLACAKSYAAEPLFWERTPNRPAPAQFDTFHGESLDFRCTFTGFGALPFAEGADVRLWYQTNGMGAAWWSVPATVSSNVLEAAWPPSADPGAERLTVFFGAPSNAYAAAQVRFRNSPGAHPNDLDPPSALDWQAELSTATNALWESSAAAFMPQSNAYTKAETDARIAELAPRTRLAAVTNSIIVPERIGGGNWTYGNSIAGDPTGDLVRDAALTASATDGSIYWSAQTDYTPEGEGDLTLYRYAIAWYNPYMETFQAAVWSDQAEPMPSVEADISLAFADQVDDFRSVLGLPWPESFATLDTPEPDAVDWGDFYSIPLCSTSTAYVPTQTVETVVYSLDLAAATNDLHKSLAPIVTNTVTKAFVENLGIESGISAETAANIASTVSSNAIASADTTYRRTVGLTNLNQSVQYVNITDATPSTLEIRLPTDGATKDWMVYVVSVTNVTLSLPAATWWMADVAYTNDVPPATPTALWFSQVTDDIYILGRQELTEVAIP